MIVQDINLVLSDGWVRSGYAVCPAKIGLAPELFGLLASKKVSSAGNIYVLEYVKINTIAFQETVTAEGISAPDYQTILDTLTSYFQQIYGSDAYLEPDSKDGQMVALAIHDANNTVITVYNCFSPATGYGAALASNVKINVIARKGATNSTVDLLLTGTAGTTITNGTVKDTNNVIWRLPASVVIGVDGTVTATAIRAYHTESLYRLHVANWRADSAGRRGLHQRADDRRRCTAEPYLLPGEPRRGEWV